MSRKQIIISIVALVLIVAGAIFGINYKREDVEHIANSVETIVNTIDNIVEENNVIVSEQTEELVIQTKEALNSSEDISTTEIIEGSEEEEQKITDEGVLETDAIVEQENISYNGDNSGKGLSLLSGDPGLTYYSQADSRWANVMYSSIGDSSQTMKSSACGPTSAAMVVSSSKGAILPTTMAQLAIDNGYRTANSGTAWSYFNFVADYFDFNEYHSTGNFDTMLSYLSQKDDNRNNKYYVIASCGAGLFTSGGHYIVLVSDDDGTITIHDPYVYSREI